MEYPSAWKLEVQRDYTNHSFYIKEKIGDQTYRLEFFEQKKYLNKIITYSIYACVYSKRKHELSYESNITSTGKLPFVTISFMLQAFKKLEATVVENGLLYHNKVVIYCRWLDNRRRDAYYKILHKYGYEYNNYDGSKCIMKEFTKANI